MTVKRTMKSKHYSRSAYAVLFLGSVLGYVLAFTYSPLVGLSLFGVAGAVGLSAPPVSGRLETRERFLAAYGSYEGFRARAPEVVDYERLFRFRDARSRRALIRFVMLHVPDLPRQYAKRFVDGLTEADRPSTLAPPTPSPSPADPRKRGDA